MTKSTNKPCEHNVVWSTRLATRDLQIATFTANKNKPFSGLIRCFFPSASRRVSEQYSRLRTPPRGWGPGACSPQKGILLHCYTGVGAF